MERIDLHYLCTTIGNLSGIPIRIFEGNALDFYYSIVYLPKDPLLPWQREVLAIPEHVGYYVTPQFHYYCVVNAGNTKLVVGPARQIRESEQELRALAFQLDLAGEEADALIAGVRSIVRMPVESVLQMLCTMNYVLNGEKLELRDISIHEQEQTALASRQERRRAARRLSVATEETAVREEHNTYDLEKRLLYMVRKGDSMALKSGSRPPPPFAAAWWPTTSYASAKTCSSLPLRWHVAPPYRAGCRWMTPLRSATPTSSNVN